MLCGISSRFQLLSPSERQVAHALLTRPPLSLPLFHPKNQRRSFVRLACVRHAASVRPEPGSNSLKYCIKTHLCASTYFRAQSLFSILTYHFFFRCISCSFRNYCVRVLLSPKKSRVPFPSLFNFQGSLAAPLSAQLCKYSTSVSLCQELFESFSNFFFQKNHALSATPLFLGRDLILSPLFALVNTLFCPFPAPDSAFVHSSGRFCVGRFLAYNI